MNRIVARFQDGQMLKGFTNDFLPAKEVLHVSEEGQPPGSKAAEIHVSQLKALFFVKSLAGDAAHQEVMERTPGKAGGGRSIRVIFKDGEVIVGTTQGYDRTRPGFFVTPVDPASNNERCFVVAAATKEVSFI
jgi:hypothetical protein